MSLLKMFFKTPLLTLLTLLSQIRLIRFISEFVREQWEQLEQSMFIRDFSVPTIFFKWEQREHFRLIFAL